MSTSRGDSEANVQQNRNRFLKQFNVTGSDVAQGRQVSLDGIESVQGPGIYDRCDALITDQKQVVLSVLTADCAPVMIWSSDKPLVASVHSGWQGSELDILGKTIKRMVADHSVTPASLHMVIGPGLTVENFEVGPEFSDKFPGKYLHDHEQGRFKFDNNRYLGDRAQACGILPSQIEVLKQCTYADGDLFFSHRRDKNVTGRMMSIIGIT